APTPRRIHSHESSSCALCGSAGCDGGAASRGVGVVVVVVVVVGGGGGGGDVVVEVTGGAGCVAATTATGSESWCSPPGKSGVTSASRAGPIFAGSSPSDVAWIDLRDTLFALAASNT